MLFFSQKLGLMKDPGIRTYCPSTRLPKLRLYVLSQGHLGSSLRGPRKQRSTFEVQPRDLKQNGYLLCSLTGVSTFKTSSYFPLPGPKASLVWNPDVPELRPNVALGRQGELGLGLGFMQIKGRERKGGDQRLLLLYFTTI